MSDQNNQIPKEDVDDTPELIRRRRPQTRNAQSSQSLSVTAKLGGFAFMFIAAVFGYWMMSSSHVSVSDEELPEIIALNDSGEFKSEPGEEDTFRIPHDDKKLYNALESKQGKTKAVTDTIVEPAADSPVIEVETKTTSDQSTPETHDANSVSKDETDLSQKMNTIEMASEKEADDTNINESSSNSNGTSDKIEIVDKPQTAQGSQRAQKTPYKSLSQAVNETQRTIHSNSSRMLNSHDVHKGKLKNVELDIEPTSNNDDVNAQASVAEPENKMVHTNSKQNEPDKSSPVIKTGSFWLQVGSLPTESAASQEIQRLRAKTRADFNDKTFETKRVDLGKKAGIRYRIHMGSFATRTEAERARAALSSLKIDSLIVKV